MQTEMSVTSNRHDFTFYSIKSCSKNFFSGQSHIEVEEDIEWEEREETF